MQDKHWRRVLGSVLGLGLGTAAIAAAAGLPAGAGAPAAGDGLVVAVDGGRVQGVDSGGLRVFKGVPYAAPPVGECESPPTQNMPGRTWPCSDTTTWQMPTESYTWGSACSRAQSRAMRTMRRDSSSASGT